MSNNNMDINIEKREKRFLKEFSSYKSNPYFKTIKELYLNNKLKNTSSVQKYFNNIRIKKDNDPYKNSIKYVKQIEDKKDELKIELFNEGVNDLIHLGKLSNKSTISKPHKNKFLIYESIDSKSGLPT